MQTSGLVWQRLVVVLFLLTSPVAILKAQIRAGLPTAPPDGSAALDVSGGPYPSGSEYRGIAPPKVALSKTSASTPVTKPATGLLIYNTATVNDVTPGYYYWEGTRWLRFETATKAAARVAAAGGGQYVKTFVLADLSTSAFTTPYPDSFILVEPGREGLFVYDPTDTSTPNDDGLTLVTGVRRYKRTFDGLVNVKWFGAKGDGTTDDTQAFQKAINSNRKVYVPRSTNSYLIYSPLVKNNNGSLILEGETVDVTLQMMTDQDLISFTSNGAGGGFIQISNLSLFAGGNFNSAAAINIKAGLYQKVAYLSNIRISRPDTNKEFKYGIRIENPNEAILKDIIVAGNNTSKLIGVSLTATQAAVSPTLTNVKVYDAKTGVSISSTTRPAIEGVKLYGCDFVAVEVGFDAKSTFDPNLYLPPGLQLNNCHVNASIGGINIANYVQVDITNAIIYCNGGGSYNYGMNFEGVSESSISFSKVFRIGSGNVYGVLANNGLNSNLKVAFNHFRLRPDGNEQGVWFGTGTSYSHALYNTVIGLSAGSDVYNQNNTNTLVGNSKQ